jgi:soluble lytic murein transglycosylase-like protein
MDSNDRYDSLFQFYSEVVGVDWLLMKAQVKQESGFDPNVSSKAGAIGLAQFMPRTFMEWKVKMPDTFAMHTGENQLNDARDPEDSIRLQSGYMASLLKRYSGLNTFALAAYNWGMGNVDKLFAQSHDWQIVKSQAPQETQDYPDKILASYNEYKTPPVSR